MSPPQPPPPPPQRRAQTYDNYAPAPSLASEYAEQAGQTGSATAARSLSMRDRSSPVDPALDPNDPPLPSYNALMAFEAQSMTTSPQPFDDQSQVPLTQGHSKTPSLDHAPYAPVDYGLPSSQYPSHSSQHGHDPSIHSIPPHRLSGGSLGRRPVSDPNDIDFAPLSFTSSQPVSPTHGARQQSLPPASQHAPRQPHPQRQRTVTGDYPSTRQVDGAASVYSLDTGMNAYDPYGSAGYGYKTQTYGQSGYPQADYSNPYYTAANDFLGLPPGSQPPPIPPQPQASSSTLPMVSRQRSTAALSRTNTSHTTTSALSSTSSVSLARVPTEVVGASSTRRRGILAAVDVSKPPYTKQYVDDYRKRMKDDPDPEAQFAYAKYLIEAAKKIGDEISERDPKLGRKYRDSLLQESLRTIKKLAESKEPYPDAQFFLANLYGTGQLGLQVDHEKAYYLYLMASKLNHPAATYRSAVCNEIGAGTRKDANRAVLFYRKAAALGDTAAMYKLSMILLGGLLGHPRNPREAIVWLRRAASQADEDNPHALHELALLHERPNNGGIVPYDPNMARELFMQAAQLQYAPAQFKLGACHEFGHLGCPIDPRKSIAWYTRAAEKGDSEAELALSGWYLTGSEGVLKQSDTEAYLWGRKAANKGLAKAEYAVGYYTEMGIGVKQDIESAKRWYMRAAAQQHKGAMQRLTELSNTKNPRGKKGARPTRHEASNECLIM